jgi:hypothetical protein
VLSKELNYATLTEAMHTAIKDTMASARSKYGKKGATKGNDKVDAMLDTKDELEASVNKVLESEDKDTALAKFNAIVVRVFKKVFAALKGTFTFLCDVVFITVVGVSTVTYCAIKETVKVGIGVGQAFNKDIIQTVKRA